MGRLLIDYKAHADWYFTNVWISQGHQRIDIATDFPFFVPIFGPDVEAEAPSSISPRIALPFRLGVQAFVEKTLAGDAVPVDDFLDLSYWTAATRPNASNRIAAWWWIIAFQQETDAAIFRLNYAPYVKKIEIPANSDDLDHAVTFAHQRFCKIWKNATEFS